MGCEWMGVCVLGVKLGGEEVWDAEVGEEKKILSCITARGREKN